MAEEFSENRSTPKEAIASLSAISAQIMRTTNMRQQAFVSQSENLTPSRPSETQPTEDIQPAKIPSLESSVTQQPSTQQKSSASQQTETQIALQKILQSVQTNQEHQPENISQADKNKILSEEGASKKSMLKCWAEALTHMTDFESRTSRYEFWAFQSVSLVIFLLMAFVGYLLAQPRMVLDIFAVYFLLPAASSCVRRLHDISLSGWWCAPVVILALATLIAWNMGIHNMVLLLFATLVYSSYLLNLLRQQGDKQDNKYGKADSETEIDYLESRAFISFMTTFFIGLWIIYAAYLLKF